MRALIERRERDIKNNAGSRMITTSTRYLQSLWGIGTCLNHAVRWVFRARNRHQRWNPTATSLDSKIAPVCHLRVCCTTWRHRLLSGAYIDIYIRDTREYLRSRDGIRARDPGMYTCVSARKMIMYDDREHLARSGTSPIRTIVLRLSRKHATKPRWFWREYKTRVKTPANTLNALGL